MQIKDIKTDKLNKELHKLENRVKGEYFSLRSYVRKNPDKSLLYSLGSGLAVGLAISILIGCKK